MCAAQLLQAPVFPSVTNADHFPGSNSSSVIATLVVSGGLEQSSFTFGDYLFSWSHKESLHKKLPCSDSCMYKTKHG